MALVDFSVDKMIYFIYDAAARTAYFTRERPDAAFIGIKDSVHLYITEEPVSTPVIPILYSPDQPSILLSNLQKAIRRREHAIAVRSSILLLQRDPMEMLRCLEEVDSFPVVWLRMAGCLYRLTTHDVDILLHTVYALCNKEVNHLARMIQVDYNKIDYSLIS